VRGAQTIIYSDEKFLDLGLSWIMLWFECITRWIECALKMDSCMAFEMTALSFVDPPPTLTDGVKSIIYDGGMLWLFQVAFVSAGDKLRGERRRRASAEAEEDGSVDVKKIKHPEIIPWTDDSVFGRLHIMVLRLQPRARWLSGDHWQVLGG